MLNIKLGFVFTNYNNSLLTEAVIHSISLIKEIDEYHIVVIDNLSDDKNISLLRKIEKENKNVTIIYNKNNAGYFGGLNIGIKHLRNIYKDIEYIIIGNNDLEFPSEFYYSLINKIEKLLEYPVLSPDLITLDGIHQNPHVIKKISKIRELIWDLYYFEFRLSLIIKWLSKITNKFTDRKDEQQYDIAQTIYQGYGACYILGPIFFKHFDQLWAPTFLMNEEFFLSRQLQEKGLKIYYEPSIKVNHHDHATLNKLDSKKLWQISRAAHKVYRKYIKVFGG